MAHEGRRSSASNFAARLGLKPLSSITQPTVDQQGRSMSTPGGGSQPNSPAHSRRSSHSEAVSMSSLPARSLGAYPKQQQDSSFGGYSTNNRSRRASAVAGQFPGGGGGGPTSKTGADDDEEATAGARIHARKPSTVERNPSVVRRGSSIYGPSLASGRLSMAASASNTPAGPNQNPEAEQQDRAERLQTNTAALVLAAKNLLGWDIPDLSGESELSRLLGLLFWDGSKLVDEVTGVQVDGGSMEKAQAFIAFRDFCSELVSLLTQVSSNTTFQAMWSSIITELSPLWASENLSTGQTMPLADIMATLEQTVLSTPDYHHAFLQLLASFCKLWSSCQRLRESYFLQVSGTWDHFTHSKATLEAIDATITQLTGLPFPPLLRALLNLFFDFNDILDLFVGEVEAFLAAPLPLSAHEVYRRHPASGQPYCPEEASTRVHIICHRFRNLLAHQPIQHSITKALARSRKMWEGISGNSAVLRFYRAFRRLSADLVAFDKSGAFELTANCDEIASVLRQLAAGLGRVSLDPISSKNDSVDIELKEVTFKATDIIPDHIALTKSTDWTFGKGQGVREQICLNLEGIEVDAQHVLFNYNKSGVSDSGRADIHLAADLRILFTPNATGALPAFDRAIVKVKACDVSMKGTGKDQLYQLAWPLVRNSMVAHIQTAVETFISSKLEFLFKKPDTEPVTPLSRVLRAQSKSANASPRSEPTETYLSARARFRREITGITTGVQSRDLDNPLEDSVPSSPTMPTSKKLRAGSMASYLSDVATADATDLKNIQRPPRARGSSAAFAIDSASESEEEEVTNLRRSRRHTETGMNMDDYEAAAQDLESQEQRRSGRRMTMSNTLSEMASRDTTTGDGVTNPPRYASDEQHTADPSMSNNLSMDRVTRALSGLAESERRPSVLDKPIRASPMPMAPPSQGLSRRKSMSEWLNNETTKDHTQLTKPGGDYNVPNKHGVPTSPSVQAIPLKERRDSAMRHALTETASKDGTLQENIASPPGSNPASRAGSFANRSRPSFTGLKNRFSMAESLDADLEEDETLPETRPRRKSSVNEPLGLSKEEMKQRRQSFKLDAKAMADGTQYENVASPPMAEPTIQSSEEKPNPLSRRPSTVYRA